MLSQGTTKLGEAIFGWSIPPVRTCPGRSETCSRLCYATHGRFATNKVKKLMQWRFEQSKRKDFVDLMVDEIYRRGVLVCRIHVSGDFYSPTYTGAWTSIAARSPQTRFFAYTRSYRVEAIETALREFSALENVRLWYSADAEMGYPEDVPEGVRVAWLQDSERKPDTADLVFQVRKVREKEPGRVSLPLVCPQETPEGKRRGTTCASCQICWA